MSRTPTPPWLDRIREAPDRPGVYLFLGERREILYVGKARSLRQRLASYRQITDRKVALLHRHARDVEWWVTDAEASALLLEAQLIRHHKPPYNIRLRENRGYAYLRLTVQEPFPRFEITRQPTDDGALYLGPYPEIGALRKSLRILRQAFPLRTCTLDLPPRRPLPPCLDYHLGLCGAPCAGLEDETTYRKRVEDLRRALEGKAEELETQIEKEIQQAVQRLAFEYAATLRDRLLALRKVQRLRGGSLPTTRLDILVVHAEGSWALAMILRWEDEIPRKEGLFHFTLPPGTDQTELIRTVVETLYLHRPDLPHILVIDPMPDPEDRAVLETVLGISIRVAHSQERRILQTARETLRFEVQQLLERRRRLPRSLEELQALLDLPAPPVRMEAVDLSHLGGRDPVASVVVFERGRPRRSAYRRYRIKEAPGGDDYAGMGEVVYRRLVRLLNEKRPLPDLLLVDGGLGQVRAARLAARRAGIPDEDLPIVGLAKRLELLIREDGAQIQLPGRSPALQLLQRLRNEAHRFARTYQTLRRKKSGMRSILDEIPGVGEARKRLLLRHFGTVEALRGASLEDLQQVPGIGPRLARTIYETLHRD